MFSSQPSLEIWRFSLSSWRGSSCDRSARLSHSEESNHNVGKLWNVWIWLRVVDDTYINYKLLIHAIERTNGGETALEGFCAFILQTTRNAEREDDGFKILRAPFWGKTVKRLSAVYSYAFIIILSGKSGNYQLLNEGSSMQNRKRKLKSFIPTSPRLLIERL